MADTGAKPPQSALPPDGWTSPSNVFADDGSYANAGFTKEDPVLDVEIYSDSVGGYSATGKTLTLSYVNGVDDTGTAGSSSDLWGTTWIPSDFDDGTFKVKMSADPGFLDGFYTQEWRTFDFGIPPDATIDGIVVSAKGYGGDGINPADVMVDYLTVTVYYTQVVPSQITNIQSISNITSITF